MKQLTELEQRILSELNEAGEESVLTLAVTALEGAGTSTELDDFKSALSNLTTALYIQISVSIGADRRLSALPMMESIREIDAISSFLKFDAAKKRWADIRRIGPPFGETFPYVINTTAGKEIGFQILDRRGYQWWRPRK